MSRLGAIVLAAGLAAAGAALPAAATPLTWTLHNVMLSDGATASGTYVYDAATNSYGTINVTTTSGPLVAGATYTLSDPAFPPFSSTVILVTGPAADYTGTPALQLALNSAMTDAGGTITFDLAASGEFTCNDPACFTGTLTRTVANGFVSTTGVPEPATLALLSGALIGFGAARRRRRTK